MGDLYNLFNTSINTPTVFLQCPVAESGSAIGVLALTTERLKIDILANDIDPNDSLRQRMESTSKIECRTRNPVHS